jgi:hypothetical protein
MAYATKGGHKEIVQMIKNYAKNILVPIYFSNFTIIEKII